MYQPRKLTAGLKVATVSAVFWGTATLLASIGLSVIQWGFRVPGNFRSLALIFLLGAGVGFVGGALYAAAIALAPGANRAQGLSGVRAALYGLLAGEAVYLLLRLGFPEALGPGPALGVVFPAAALGALGAATGAAIHGTAQRASLRDGAQDGQLP